jgi:putative zinc finger/helix-turn-helix YgiT family protein
MIERRENYKYDFCGLPGVVLEGVVVGRCPNCGESAVTIQDIDGLHRLIASMVATKRSRLTDREVRFLRKWLGWSGSQFAAWMQTDPSTVSRWESGKQFMSKQAEGLLRLYALKTVDVDSYESLLSIDDEVGPLHEARVRPTREGWVLDAAA